MVNPPTTPPKTPPTAFNYYNTNRGQTPLSLDREVVATPINTITTLLIGEWCWYMIVVWISVRDVVQNLVANKFDGVQKNVVNSDLNLSGGNAISQELGNIIANIENLRMVVTSRQTNHLNIVKVSV